MTIWGVDATYWVSGTALLVSVAAAIFSALQWRINARKERRELSATDPLVHIEPMKSAGNGWILLKLSVQRHEDVRFESICVDVVTPRTARLRAAEAGRDSKFIIPSADAGCTESLPIRPANMLFGGGGISGPPLRSDYWFWFSPRVVRATSIRLRISLRSSSLPIRTWKKTVTAKLTSETVSAMTAKVSAVADDKPGRI